MINGAHAIIYSHDPEADRTFFKEVLGLHHVDAGGGWLIFALPPAEVAVHPAEPGKPGHELFLMCRDIDAAVKELTGKGVHRRTPVPRRTLGTSGIHQVARRRKARGVPA